MKSSLRFSLRLFQRSLLSLLFFVPAASSAAAQTELTGAIRGVVKEQSGGVIPNATVTLQSEASQMKRTVLTNQNGQYAVMGLPPGSGYQITVNAASFRTAQRTLTTLASGDSLTQDFTLEISGLSETINITSDAPVVVSNAPEVSQVVDARRIRELPSNGRSLNRFALLDPHVRNTAGQGSDGAGAARLTINANSFRVTHYRLDGSSNYESVYANTPQQQLSLAAVQEFKVLTNQYSAEYGNTTAGIIVATTKSGSDEFHGEGFTFLRPSGIQARPPVSSLRVPNELWQFGGALGGPIVKTKLNFFANAERSRFNRGAFIQSPTPQIFTGKFRDTYALTRVDYRFDDTHSLGLRLNGHYSETNNSGDAVSGFTQPSAARLTATQSASGQITDRKTWGALLNELRVGYSNIVPSGSRPFGAPTVAIVRPNYSTEGTSAFSFTRTKNIQLADQLAWQSGKHELRLGGEYQRQKVVDDSFSLYGTYTLSPGAPAANEVPVQYAQTFGRQLIRYGQTLAAGFAQDNWRVASRLTLNLGARYEYQSVTNDRNNIAPRLGFAWDVFGNGNTVVRGGGGVFYDQYYLYIYRRFFFQGVNAYQLAVTLKPTDAGFPTFPNSLITPPGGAANAARDLYVSNDKRLNAYSQQYSFGVQQKLFGGLTLTADGITQRNLKQPRAIDINAPAAFTRTAVGQTRSSTIADKTRPLYNATLSYSVYQGTKVRNVTRVENTANSDYDALDIALVKGFAHRYQLEAHYVYSNALTDSMFIGEPNTGVPNDWNGNLRTERGPSDYHQRHRFVSHGLVELPLATQASFIATIGSGLPIDSRTGVDNNGDTYVVDRPFNPATGAAFSRNAFRAPMQASFDLSLAKRVQLHEKLRLELRAEAFNLANRNNYIRVNSTWGNGSAPLATFRKPIAGAGNSDPARQFQFAARLVF